MDLTKICKIFHVNKTEHIFSEAHGTFSQAIQENRFLYSDHNEIKLEINSKKNYTNLWKVNKTLLNGKNLKR